MILIEFQVLICRGVSLEKNFSLFREKARKKLFWALRNSSRRVCTDSTRFRTNRVPHFFALGTLLFSHFVRKNHDLLLQNIAILLWLWLLFEQQIIDFCFRFCEANDWRESGKKDEAWLKCRKNRYVLQSNTICVTLYREAPLKVFGSFFKKNIILK